MTPEERQNLMEHFVNDDTITEYLRGRGVPFSHPKGVRGQKISDKRYVIAGGTKFTETQITELEAAGFKLINEWYGLFAETMASRLALIEDVA